MNPTSLEQLLFLFFKKDLWKNQNIVDVALTWEKEESLKVAEAASAAAIAVVAAATAAVFAVAQEHDEDSNQCTLVTYV